MFKKIMLFITSMGMLSLINLSQAQTINPNAALNAKQQSIISIAALTAVGDLDQLSVSLHEGLEAGLTINEIKEILIQMYAYAGFPRSLNGINTFETVLQSRQTNGINDAIGEEAKTVRANNSKYEIGKENLTLLTGAQPPTKQTGYAAFVPTIEVFLKEHLFADIFERGVLDFQTRELATISALASIGGVNGQLRSHLNVGLHNQLSEAQLRSLITIVGRKVNEKEAKNATTVLNQVLTQRP